MNDPRKDAGETLEALNVAVTEAREFFGIDPLYETPVLADGDGAAKIDMEPGRFWRPISVNLDYYQRRPDQVRPDMAHEVAHLVTDELCGAMQRMPPEWSDDGEPLAMLMLDALERATHRLEAVFLRERPVGGDGYGRPRLSASGPIPAKIGDEIHLSSRHLAADV